MGPPHRAPDRPTDRPNRKPQRRNEAARADGASFQFQWTIGRFTRCCCNSLLGNIYQTCRRGVPPTSSLPFGLLLWRSFWPHIGQKRRCRGTIQNPIYGGYPCYIQNTAVARERRSRSAAPRGRSVTYIDNESRVDAFHTFRHLFITKRLHVRS